MVKLVSTVNPFITEDTVVSKGLYNELSVVPARTSKETDEKS